MARVGLSDSWDLVGDLSILRSELLAFLAAHKMAVVEESGDEVQTIWAKQGSQLWTRLLGGWFVSAATLPKKARLTFTTTTR